MSTPPLAFVYSDALLQYDLGPKHPLQQVRLQKVRDCLAAYGALAPAGPILEVAPTPADEAFLSRVHTGEYLDAVREASRGARGGWLSEFGLGPGDTPAFPGIYDASRLYAGGSIDAAKWVLSGRAKTAFNVAGGLHHAHPGRASGFCTFNDCALAAHVFLDSGIERVAYVDIDAHHGDGTEACFYDDPRVLTISMHESGRWLFPGTGFAGETGGPNARGSSVNVPLAPYTTDKIWWDAFLKTVPVALETFRPGALVLQLGADAHFGDPLAHLQVTSRVWMDAVGWLLDFGKDIPVVITGGGGYNQKTVVRLWTMVSALAAGVELSDSVPEDFARQHGIERLHDTDEPVVAPDVIEAARKYAAGTVAELSAAHGWQSAS